MRILKTKKSFKKEFRRQLRYAIAAAVGFIIVFAWRDAILNTAKELVEKFTDTTKIITTNLATALLISAIGVLILVVSSRLLREK